ncbi:MAG TPA: protein translocase subunit SecF, partial [Bacillales bacterium]|nr:protein translocase subunit SecF [Bacillales bacterium]
MIFNYKTAKFDFVKSRNIFFALSAAIIIAGIIVLFVKGLNLGIDFTEGTRVEVLTNHTVSVDKMQQEYNKMGFHPVKIVQAGKNGNIGSARFDKKLTKEQQFKIKNHFQKAYGKSTSVNISAVSPQVGRTMAKNAMLAVAIASIGIIIYVWIRFEFLQGLAAIVALLHDVFFIISV